MIPETSENGPFYINLVRWGRQLYKDMEKMLAREMRNAEEIRIPGRMGSVKVIRPEDIIAPKLLRRKDKDIDDIDELVRKKRIDRDYLKESLSYYRIGGEVLEDLYAQFLRISQKV